MGEFPLREKQKPKWKVKSATYDNYLKNTSEDAPQLPLASFVFIARASTIQNEPLFPNLEINFLPKGSTDPISHLKAGNCLLPLIPLGFSGV